MVIHALRGDWLSQVQLLRTFLGWAGLVEAVLGAGAYLFFAVMNLQQFNIPEAPSQRPHLLFLLLTGTTYLFYWVIPLFCWAVLTVLLKMYEYFLSDEAPAHEPEP